ncbi:MAG: RNase H1/viroplasmin domain-containing protein, partial [Chloroflexi bacterium]|nr:RNase H1/viroplasmin domain-containing protein [Chloroflexota bacterium]
MAEKPKYYVVWKGRKTGVFSSWEACAAQVQGFTGAQYK